MGISVVICTYDGRLRLQSTLDALLRQTIDPILFEIIVVDNASRDNTSEFCEHYLMQSGAKVSWQVVSEPIAGLNFARQKGLKQARFDFVLFCDDDNMLEKDYLSIGYTVLRSNDKIGVLGGCGIPLFEGAMPEWFDQFSHSFAVGSQANEDGKIKKMPAAVYGAGSFYRKAPILSFFNAGFHSIMSDRKGKNLTSGGDIEWCYLIQLAGYDVWYDHRLVFQHALPFARLQWEYYVRLKIGISSGAGRLQPYVSLINNPQMPFVIFVFNWSIRALTISSAYLKNIIIAAAGTKGPLQPATELARAVLQTRFTAYWKNGITAFRHFLYLKRLLNALHF